MFIIENRNIYFKYFIVKSYNAGLVLEGWEVKFIKIKHSFEIKNSFIISKENNFFLKNSFISKYNNNINSKTNRERKILLKKKEIKEINQKCYKSKFKLLPLLIFIKNKYIKIKIVIVIKKNILYKNEKNF